MALVKRVAEFWRFVVERHNIFVRRVVRRLPPPWTQDPVLASVYFTNVYRELDRGTRFVIRDILPSTLLFEERLWRVLVYRIFNYTPTYQALWPVLDRGWASWSAREASRLLGARRRQGHRLFTNAFTVYAGPVEGVPKHQHVIRELSWTQRRFTKLGALILRALSMEQAHQALTKLPGFGPFMAYEVVVDLCYNHAVLPFSEDDWVNPGPGAIKGASRIFGRRVTAKETVALICNLRHGQQAQIEHAGRVLYGPPLTLRNIEHSLCEFQKYSRAQETGGRKRGYNPAMASDDYAPWEGLPLTYSEPWGGA